MRPLTTACKKSSRLEIKLWRLWITRPISCGILMLSLLSILIIIFKDNQSQSIPNGFQRISRPENFFTFCGHENGLFWVEAIEQETESTNIILKIDESFFGKKSTTNQISSCQKIISDPMIEEIQNE
jgi:hypothetical protein